LFTASLSFFSSCSSHKKTTPQPGEFEYKKTGIASYYANKFQSRRTASGEIFDNNLMTAAHRSLPFGTNVVVKNLNNGKSVKVTINDRGPFTKKRIIDLSRAAFAKIENINKGVTKVEIMVVN
jgi:rare lipoprotein A